MSLEVIKLRVWCLLIKNLNGIFKSGEFRFFV